jgi:hypothetical protein
VSRSNRQHLCFISRSPWFKFRHGDEQFWYFLSRYRKKPKFYLTIGYRSRRPRGLKRGSAAAVLLGLRVLIPRGGMDVCLECSQVEVCASDRSIVQGSPTECLCHCNISPLYPQWVCRRVQSKSDRLLLLPATLFQVTVISYTSTLL